MTASFVLSIDEAAEALTVSVADIESEINAGRLKSVRIGTAQRIIRRDLDRFLQAQGSRGLAKPRRLAPVAMVMFFGAGLAWAAADFPFPNWQHFAIGPQSALFVDDQALTEPDPTRFALINAPLDYRRFNEAPNPDGTGDTQMLMSLQHQNDVPSDSESYPWTFFVNLDTNHDRGDAVGSIVNLWKRGSGWSAAYHADVFAYGSGAAIGNNIETYDIGEERSYLIGLNVQNKAHRGNAALQVQTGPMPDWHPWWEPGMDGGWIAGLRLAGMPGAGYYRTGIEFDRHTHGRRGMWMRGQFDIGLDLGSNSIRMAGGTPLELDGSAGIALRYNPARERIEFVNGDEVIAWLDASTRGIDLAD